MLMVKYLSGLLRSHLRDRSLGTHWSGSFSQNGPPVCSRQFGSALVYWSLCTHKRMVYGCFTSCFSPSHYPAPLGHRFCHLHQIVGQKDIGLSLRSREYRSCLYLHGNLLISLSSIIDIWKKGKRPTGKSLSQ